MANNKDAEVISIGCSDDDLNFSSQKKFKQVKQVAKKNESVEEEISIIEVSLSNHKRESDNECSFINVEDDVVQTDNMLSDAEKFRKFQKEKDSQSTVSEDTAGASSENDEYIDVCESDTESSLSVDLKSAGLTHNNNTTKSAKEQNTETMVNPSSSKMKISIKKRLKMTNHYGLYCSQCDETFEKVHGKKMTTCKNCQHRLVFYCKKCKKEYKNFIGVYQHIISKHSLKKQHLSESEVQKSEKLDSYSYFCPTCNKTVPKIYRKPMTYCNSCNNDFQYSCSNCYRIYTSLHGIYLHMKRGKCSVPASTPQEGSVLKEAKLSVGANVPKSKVECKKCGDEYREVPNGDDVCKEVKLFQCFTCSFRCCHKSNLKRHMETHHGTEDFTDVCADTKDNEQLQLFKHLDESYQEIFTGASKVKKSVELHCSRCSVTSEPRRLRFFNREECGQCQDLMLYQCKNCKLQYSSWSAVYSHLRNDCFGEGRYACNHCSYRAKQKGNLQSHVERKHMPRLCHGCDVVYADCETLKKHQRTSSCRGRHLECDLCAFSCASDTRMKQHMRDEHRARHTCPECGKKYRNVESLKKHRKFLCLRESTFECEHCYYKAYTKSALLSHLRNKHFEDI